MAINLRDIRNACITYLENSVTMSVTPPVADAPEAISPDEEFTYSVTATNDSGPKAVQLTNVVYHVTTNGVVKLKVPASPPARASLDASAPTLPSGPNAALVSEMFLFRGDDTLGTGDADTIEGLKGKGLVVGDATIKASIYAEVDEDWLFAIKRSTKAERAFPVV